MAATPQSRLPLWRAFSEFFLDTEVQEYVHAYVAREIRASGLTLQEAESVLWNEVYPVLSPNLISITGVWSGWPDEWLVERICIQPYAPAKNRWKPLAGRKIQECWDKTLLAFQEAQQKQGQHDSAAIAENSWKSTL